MFEFFRRLFGKLTPAYADPASPEPASSTAGKTAIKRANLSAAMKAMAETGVLNLSKTDVKELPEGLTADALDVSECPHLVGLPNGLNVGRIDASKCSALAALPSGLVCHELNLAGTAVESLPADVKVDLRLDLGDCRQLKSLPAGLRTGSLVLRNCTSLTSLPAGLETCFLDLEGCAALAQLPADLSVRLGRLNVRDCRLLPELPANLGPLAQLNLANCERIAALPQGMVVTSWLDLGGTQIKELPGSMAGIQLRWRDVPIDERIAFRPESLSAEEILHEANVEKRRVMLERFGFQKFIDQVKAEVVDTDRDAGGERRLLRLKMEGDEDLVCVSVLCPSTGRQFLIRVPPTTTTCRQAVAWTAGFDDPRDYRPLVET